MVVLKLYILIFMEEFLRGGIKSITWKLLMNMELVSYYFLYGDQLQKNCCFLFLIKHCYSMMLIPMGMIAFNGQRFLCLPICNNYTMEIFILLRIRNWILSFLPAFELITIMQCYASRNMFIDKI